MRFDRVLRATISTISGVDLTEQQALGEEDNFHFELGEWLLGRDLRHRGTAMVILFFLCSLVVAFAFSCLELYFADKESYFLSPIIASWTKPEILIFYFYTTPAAVVLPMVLLRLPAYRRPCLFFGFVPVVATIAVAISGNMIEMMILATLIPAGYLGLFTGWLFGLPDFQPPRD